jgi:hypothetical protein
MEETTETTTQAPKPDIYYPELEKPSLVRPLLIIAGILLLLFIVISIATKKEKHVENPYIKAQIDSLAKANDSLRIKQAKLDSTSAEYQIQIDNLDWKVQNVGEKKTVIREYYHEKVKEPARYTPQQVDSFFKKRYNY